MYGIGVFYYWAVIIALYAIYLLYDLIRDFYNLFKGKKKAFLALFLDFVRFAVIGAIIFVVTYFTTGSNVSDYGVPSSLGFNSKELNAYVCRNEEIQYLTDKIKEEYGINIYVDVLPEKIINGGYYSFELESEDEDVINTLNEVYMALGKYNKLSLYWMPSNFFVVSKITDDENGNDNIVGLNQSGSYVLTSTDYIILKASACSTNVIDHEIMHSLDSYLNYRDIKEVSLTYKDKCSLIRDYACTNYYETFAESWSTSFNIYRDNELFTMYEKYYRRFLYGLRDDYFEDIKVFDSAYYEDLNTSEKKTFSAIDSIEKGQYLRVDVTTEELENAIEKYSFAFPNNIKVDNLVFYGYDGNYVIYLPDNLLLDYDEIEETVVNQVNEDLETWKNYQEYDKMLLAYRKVNDIISATENDDNLFDKYTCYNPDSVLKVYLGAIGVPTVKVCAVNENGFNKPALIALYNDSYSWINIANGKMADKVPINFLVSDEHSGFDIERVNVPYECNSMENSYAGVKGLYLEEFDMKTVNTYLKNVSSRSLSNWLIFIQCSSNEVAQETYKYLYKSYNGSPYVHNLWAQYRPELGFSYSYYNNENGDYDYVVMYGFH